MTAFEVDFKKEFLLNDEVIVVTGVTVILGESFVKGIAQAGGIVGILGGNEKVANKRVADIKCNGGEAIALIADITNEDQLLAAKEKVLVNYGKFDGLVNGAGGNITEAVILPNDDIFNLNFDVLKEVMNLNLYGSLLPTQIFGEAIKRRCERKRFQGFLLQLKIYIII